MNVCFNYYFQSPAEQKSSTSRTGLESPGISGDGSQKMSQSPQKVSTAASGDSKRKVHFETDAQGDTPVQPAKVRRKLSFNTVERPKRVAAPTSLKEVGLKNKMRQ